MSKEKANQKLREDKAALVGTMRMDENKVQRMIKEYGGIKYIPLDDVKDLLSSSARHLAPLTVVDGQYAYGIEVNVVQNILCAILMVPRESSSKDKAEDLTSDAAKSTKTYQEIHKKAVGISLKIEAAGKGKFSYEEFQDEIRKCTDPDDVKRVLTFPGSRPLPVTVASGQVLQKIESVPKALACKASFKMKLEVLSVQPSEGAAEVRVIEITADEKGILKRLLEKRILLTYPKKKEIGKTLIALQLLDHNFTCTVGVTMGLSDRSWGSNRLTFVSFSDLKKQESSLNSGLQQLSFKF